MRGAASGVDSTGSGMRNTAYLSRLGAIVTPKRDEYPMFLMPGRTAKTPLLPHRDATPTAGTPRRPTRAS
jgi:hypothetical protein